MTRLLVLGALTLTVLLWNCGGSEKTKGQSEPMPVVPDSIKNKPELPVEKRSWRLLTYTKDGAEQRLVGSDSVSITLDFQYGEALGSFGCNDFRVACTLDSLGAIQFGNNLSYSSRICKGLMIQEKTLKDLLPTMKSYSLSTDRRQLELQSDQAKMLFIATYADEEEQKAPEVKVVQ
ncbi:MAG: META domain-containing protein [Saprospiraceae bacterium]|nr:META domain-containing protein [Saprospiraceae bacterium]